MFVQRAWYEIALISAAGAAPLAPPAFGHVVLRGARTAGGERHPERGAP